MDRAGYFVCLYFFEWGIDMVSLQKSKHKNDGSSEELRVDVSQLFNDDGRAYYHTSSDIAVSYAV